jgi:hypothetical protein
MSIYKLVCKVEENISKFKTDLLYFIIHFKLVYQLAKKRFIYNQVTQ